MKFLFNINQNNFSQSRTLKFSSGSLLGNACEGLCSSSNRTSSPTSQCSRLGSTVEKWQVYGNFLSTDICFRSKELFLSIPNLWLKEEVSVLKTSDRTLVCSPTPGSGSGNPHWPHCTTGCCCSCQVSHSQGWRSFSSTIRCWLYATAGLLPAQATNF